MHSRVRAVAGRSSVVVALLGTAIALASIFDRPPTLPADAPIELRVSSVPLDPGDPSRQRIGPLVYAGGLWLASSDPRFGGLSDLRIGPDGAQLRAVSDCGRGFTATLSYAVDGRLAGLASPRMIDLVDTRGRWVAGGAHDAESLVVRGAQLEVGFEGRGQILAYAAVPPFGGPARRVPVPAGLSDCGPNAGIETMALLDPDRRLLVCEGRRSASLDVPAWLGGAGGWVDRTYPLFFEGGWAGEAFRPTSAARLAGGDVLVLERRFPPLGARVVRLSAEDLRGRGPLHPREIARIAAPLTIDNFEGLDVRQDGDGRTLVYLLSDDNNCAKPNGRRGTGLQRTLLLMFVLEG